MDRAIVERMVGAAVLVCLLVLLAPALLNGRLDDDAVAPPDAAADARTRTEVILLHAPVNVPQTSERTARATPEQPRASATRQTTASAAVTQQQKPPSGFAVQLGGFSERANAQHYATKLRQQGYKVFVVKGLSGDSTIYRVYSGPARTRSAAGTLASKLQAAGHSVMVVQLGG